MTNTVESNQYNSSHNISGTIQGSSGRKYYSRRGAEALENGEQLYADWTKEEIIAEELRIKREIPDCPPTNEARLDAIPEDILRNALLKKSSWHHVNFEPEWFYTIDEKWAAGMRNRDIFCMESDAAWFEEIRNKPRLARIKVREWKTSESGRQYTSVNEAVGVLYNGVIYFGNGSYRRLRRDECDLVEVYVKVPKGYRARYDYIRKQMRRHEIHC